MTQEEQIHTTEHKPSNSQCMYTSLAMHTRFTHMDVQNCPNEEEISRASIHAHACRDKWQDLLLDYLTDNRM